MKKKLVLSAIFIVSLLPMLLNQFGGMRGVQELRGIIILLSPPGVLSILLYLLGVWAPFPNKAIGKALAISGAVIMVAAEIFKFFTWHYSTITGEISLQSSLRLTFPEFYIGLAASVIAAIACIFIEFKGLKGE